MRRSSKGDFEELNLRAFSNLLEDSLGKILTNQERESSKFDLVAQNVKRRLFVNSQDNDTESENIRVSKEEADDLKLPVDHYFIKSKKRKPIHDPVVVEN